MSLTDSPDDEWDNFFMETGFRKKRRFWVHPLNLEHEASEYYHYCIHLCEYPDKFFQYYRMRTNTFDYILSVFKIVVYKLLI